MSVSREPGAGAGLALGHSLIHHEPRPSGWRAECECGEVFRGVREHVVLDRWHSHLDEERENRGVR